MSITVTPNASFSPPRNDITITTPSAVMTSVALYRVQNGAQTLVRQQPLSGFGSVIAEDYECPYNTPVTYTASGVSIPATPTTLWTETWANLTAWTTDVGTPSVSAGVLSFSGGLGAIHRAITPGPVRVNVTNLQLNASIALNTPTVEIIQVSFTATALTISLVTSASGGFGGAPNVVTHVISGTFAASNVQIDWIPGSQATVTMGSNVYTYGTTYTVAPTQVQALMNAAGTWGGQVVAALYSTTPSSFSFTSGSVTLTAASGWMVHPLTPALSVPISITNHTLAGISSLGPVTQASTATTHEILGSSVPVVSTTGPRLSDSLTVDFIARTLAHEAALNAILYDQTPILFRFPDSTLDWVDGFYSVGDVVRTRLAQVKALTRRDFTLPLRMVQAPVGGVTNPGWSWAGVAAAFSSWAEVAQAYNTWADMAIDNRNPGF